MKSVKTALVVFGVCLAFIFFFQNFEALRYPVPIGLNLLLWEGGVTIELWMLIILVFLIGFLAGSGFSLIQRFMMKGELKSLRDSQSSRGESALAEREDS